MAIIDTFSLMRKYISNNLLEQKYINNLVLEHDNSIKLLKESFKNFEEKKKLNEIYFNGEIFAAYSKIVEIMNEAKKELTVIDRYADITVLNMTKKIKCNITLIIKKNKPLLSELDINKYNEEYHNLKVIYDDTFHDRYIIIDKEKLYHLGSSINHIGAKTFSINIIEEKEIINTLNNKINSIL